MGIFKKRKREEERREKQDILNQVEENRGAADRVYDALDTLDYANTLKPLKEAPDGSSEADYAKWEKDKELHLVWSDKLNKYKAFVRGRFMPTMKDASGATRLKTDELDGMTENLIEWLQEAIRDVNMETADRIILALNYGICVARRDILEQEVQQEEAIRAKRIKSMEAHKNMVITCREIDAERAKAAQCKEDAQRNRQEAADTQKKLSDFCKAHPVAYTYVKTRYGTDDENLTGDDRVDVNKIIAMMDVYSTAKKSMDAKELEAMSLENHIRKLQGAIKIIHDNMNAEQNTLPAALMKYLADTEQEVRKARVARANESEAIEQLMNRLWNTYLEMDEAEKRRNVKIISEYEIIVAQEEASKAMAEKIRQDAQRNSQTQEEQKQKQTILAE